MMAVKSAGIFLIVIVGLQVLMRLFQYYQLQRQNAKEQRDYAGNLQQLVEKAKNTYQAKQALHQHTWSDLRDFVVQRKVSEAEDVHSFYLIPKDNRPLPTFLPGQYLTFSIPNLDPEERRIRCYSLSNTPLEKDYYRITVKKRVISSGETDPVYGSVSRFFNDELQKGDCVQAKTPSGLFVLEPLDNAPLVMIAGGVGITPILSMLETLAAVNPTREVRFIYAMKDGREHIMKAHLKQLAAQCEGLQLTVFYADPRPEDKKGEDYDFQGFIGMESLKTLLPSNNYRYYLCGPPAMLENLIEPLAAWGVPSDDIHYEAFGPASIARAGALKVLDRCQTAFKVTFARSDLTLTWHPQDGSILEFAENHGLDIKSGCRAGRCGTCATRLHSGDVECLSPISREVDPGMCLLCVSIPAGPLVLEA